MLLGLGSSLCLGFRLKGLVQDRSQLLRLSPRRTFFSLSGLGSALGVSMNTSSAEFAKGFAYINAPNHTWPHRRGSRATPRSCSGRVRSLALLALA